MEAKLIKTVTDNYILVDVTKEFHGEGYLLGTTTVSDAPRLSFKNCQAIERGYDLDELAIESSREYFIKPIESPIFTFGYEEGFQKALEILGDKKFSEEDMKSFARNYYREIRENTSNLLWTQLADKCIEEHIQSLQQNEWDVEVEKENVMHDYNGNISLGAKFKLDADGCLILKLKSE